MHLVVCYLCRQQSREYNVHPHLCVIFVCLSVCLSVCPHYKTKTAENKITKLGVGIVHQDTSPIDEYRSKVKGQGHRIKKCKII